MKLSIIKILFLCLLLTLCCSMISCESASDSPSPPDTQEQPEELPEAEPPKKVDLAQDGSACCTIVYSAADGMPAKACAEQIAAALKAITGATFQVTEDTKSTNTSTAPELLIGNTTRQESITAKQILSAENAYIVKATDYKIAIVANSTVALEAATDHFLSNYIGWKSMNNYKKTPSISVENGVEDTGVWSDPTKSPDGTTIPSAEAETQRVIYKKIGKTEITMAIYRSASSGNAAPAPVLIIFPGGGWRAADISGFAGYDNEASYLRSRGWTIVVAEYRLRADKGNESYPHLASGCGLPGMISDCMDAVRYLVKHAEVLGIDPDNICTGGHSAGGHLALMSALGNQSEFVDSSNLSAYTFEIAVATAKSGPTDCNSDAMLKSYVPLIFPKGYTTADLKKCSPINNLSDDVCPIFIGYGKNDQIFTAANQWGAFEQACMDADVSDYQIIGDNVDHSSTRSTVISNAMKAFLEEYATN